MVQAIVNIGDHQDRIINIVKGKFGLKNKSQAVNLIIDKFEDEILEPELRPEYLRDLEKTDKGKFRTFSSIKELRDEIENI